MQAVNESQRAKELAERVLSDTARDPDSDVSVLARQHLRALEQLREREAQCAAYRSLIIDSVYDINGHIIEWPSQAKWFSVISATDAGRDLLERLQKAEAERDDYRTLASCKDETATTFMNQVKRLQKELPEEKELRIMQLAGISTASIQNTETTRKDRITPDNPYYTTAYADVCRAVDREMELRDRLQAVEKKLEQAVSLLRSSDEDAVSKFLETYQRKCSAT